MFVFAMDILECCTFSHFLYIILISFFTCLPCYERNTHLPSSCCHLIALIQPWPVKRYIDPSFLFSIFPTFKENRMSRISQGFYEYKRTSSLLKQIKTKKKYMGSITIRLL